MSDERRVRRARYHPIGVTYDEPTRRVWVACCTGSIRFYDDR